MIKKWKRLSTQKLYEHPRLTLYEDSVELPDGKLTTYLHYGKDSPAAMIFAINEKGEILVQKEYSYPPDEILWQIPGGKIESEETTLQGALREFSEECGLMGDLEEIGWFYLDNRRKPDKMHVFIAKNLTQKSGLKDEEEFLEHKWLREETIEDLISNNKFPTYTALAGWAIYKNYRLSK